MKDNDIEAHIRIIKEAYGKQAKAMLESIKQYFPSGVAHTTPEGGMFLWVTLPENTFIERPARPGDKRQSDFCARRPLLRQSSGTNTLRLNFSCTDEETTEIGIKSLGKAIERLFKSSKGRIRLLFESIGPCRLPCFSK